MASGWGRRMRVEMQKLMVNQTPTTQTAWFAGLDTNTTVADDASNVTASGTEPSSSNGYARVAITWNTLTAYTSLTVDTASVASNSGSLSWTSTAGGFSTGATTLKSVTIWNTSTLATVAETAFLGRAAIAVPQAVNAGGITLTIAASGLTMGCISA